MNSYRGLLLELSNSLTSSDLQGLKFLCRDVIPAGRAERITRPFEFFSALEQLNMLSEENRDFLASKLIAINRNDLRNKLLGIQGDQNVLQAGQAATPWDAAPSSLYSGAVPDTLVHDLVEDLSTSWRMLGRRLGLSEGVIKNIDSEHRRVIEKGVAMFDEWKNRKTDSATMQALRDGLEKIGRRDLSEKVRDFALREQEAQLRAAAVEHETVEERRPFPDLNDLVAALPTVTQRQPQEQAESIHRPLPSLRGYPMPPAASGHWAPHVSGSAATADIRDPVAPVPQHALGHSDLPVSVPVHGFPSASVPVRQPAPVRQDPLMPPPQPVSGSAVVAPQHALGHSDLPVSVPVHGFPSASVPVLQPAPVRQDPLMPPPQPVSGPAVVAPQHALGHSDLPVSVPVNGFPSAFVPVRQPAPVRQDPLMPPPQPVSGPAVVAPQHALGHSDLPVSVPVHGFPFAPSHPIPPVANQLNSTLANPTLPYPVPISQPTMDDPSLQRPAPAAPGNGGPLPSGQNNSSTDDNSRQVHGPANARHFTGQDITDHGPNNGIRTSVQVESSLRLQLTVGGSFLDPEKYEPVKFLASGGFAKVYLCKSKETGRKMAVKMCNLGVNHHETQKQTEAVAKEVKILSTVKHKYIVEFLYSEESFNTLLLFLEYMEGGSVEELLRHKGPIKEPLARKFTWQILTAVEFLHNKGIIHKDIKGGNVLLDARQMNIKLADFGISTVMDKLITVTGGLMTNNTVASFHWTSPELLAKKPFSRNTDIWSVGCTVVEMLTTKPPLMEEDLDFCQRMFKIVSLDVQPPQDCSSLAYGFLTKCLCASNVRPSAAELLQTDPFVNFTEEERNQLAWLFT